MNNTEHTQLLTFQDVLDCTRYKSKSSVYRMIRQKRFPPPLVIGGGRIRWRAFDIENWLKSLPVQTYPSQEGGR